MKVTQILEMRNEKILSTLTQEELEIIDDSNIANRNHFCDLYQDGARMSGEDEYISSSEYLKLCIEDMYEMIGDKLLEGRYVTNNEKYYD